MDSVLESVFESAGKAAQAAAEAVTSHTLSRRQFLIKAGTVITVAVLSACGSRAPQPGTPAPDETIKTSEKPSLKYQKVKDVMDGVKKLPGVDTQQIEATQKMLDDIAVQVYGKEHLSDDDLIVAVTKPPADKSLVIHMRGIASPVAQGKGKGEKEPGMPVQFQRRADTRTAVIIEDPQNPNTETVWRLYSTNDRFKPLVAGSAPTSLEMGKGWGIVEFPDGNPKPVMTSLPSTSTDKSLFFVMPVTDLQQKYPGNINDLISLTAKYADLSFSARDPQ